MRFSLDDKILILDGGMGSLLQARGLPVGAAPDDWSVTNPDAVAAVHAEYLMAGAGVINTKIGRAHV